jgi:hypothetical protein
MTQLLSLCLVGEDDKPALLVATEKSAVLGKGPAVLAVLASPSDVNTREALRPSLLRLPLLPYLLAIPLSPHALQLWGSQPPPQPQIQLLPSCLEAV